METQAATIIWEPGESSCAWENFPVLSRETLNTTVPRSPTKNSKEKTERWPVGAWKNKLYTPPQKGLLTHYPNVLKDGVISPPRELPKAGAQAWSATPVGFFWNRRPALPIAMPKYALKFLNSSALPDSMEVMTCGSDGEIVKKEIVMSYPWNWKPSIVAKQWQPTGKKFITGSQQELLGLENKEEGTIAGKNGRIWPEGNVNSADLDQVSHIQASPRAEAELEKGVTMAIAEATHRNVILKKCSSGDNSLRVDEAQDTNGSAVNTPAH
ncbi:hypothetical protein K2173_010810 [Erythroxylum novogranatense]|uniref:Uncharacterized protein n=1 Tax=Erythroxylum novogranatense TaxID=1862640 RepID=A0AAV8T101_9ROSI|nr:hypothetical protein K2173_010810 [Erythroxylum novogranatense]